jgi:hypothetical protein
MKDDSWTIVFSAKSSTGKAASVIYEDDIAVVFQTLCLSIRSCNAVPSFCNLAELDESRNALV